MYKSLYEEILKYESYHTTNYSVYINKPMSSKTVEDFANEIVSNEQLRDDFLQEYVDEIIDSMNTKEIIRELSNVLLQRLYKQCDLNNEEEIVKECWERFPYVLDRYNVNVPKK